MSIATQPGSPQGLPPAESRDWWVCATDRGKGWEIQFAVGDPPGEPDLVEGHSLGGVIGELASILTDELRRDPGCSGYRLSWEWWDERDGRRDGPHDRPEWFRGRQPRVPVTIGAPR